MRGAARPLSDWLDETIAAAIAAEIKAAGGREVFFVGRTGPDGRLEEVEVTARGNQEAVPALAQAARAGDVVIHNHPSGGLEPSEADLAIAARLGADGIGFAITDNDCGALYVVAEPARPEEAAGLDLDEVAAFFAPEGPLARVLPGWEPRPAQVEMALAAAGAFNEGRVVVVEAGTGVGKSLAYLVPALLWAAGNRRRVTVSTNTINLQEQLLGSDLPVLERAGLVFRAVLVKGRRNYACLRKADEIRAEPDLFADTEAEAGALRELAAWAFTSADGSLADLSPPPTARQWEEIATEADDCTRSRCVFYNDCPFYRARRRAASADLLVVNHHLLFADLALRGLLGEQAASAAAVLPSYSHLIIDEAHHVEEVATDHFGLRISSLGLGRQLGRLQHRRRSTRGLLPLLARHLEPLAPHEPSAARALRRLLEEVRPAQVEAARRVPEHFAGLGRMAEALVVPGSEERRVRLTDDLLADPLWEGEGREGCRRLRTELETLTGALERLLRDLEALLESHGAELESPVVDVAAATSRLVEVATGLGRFAEPEDEEAAATVRWLEAEPAGRGGPRLTLAAAPIEVGPLLARVAFGAVQGALLTSATLAVEGSFDFIGERLGFDRLERGRLVTGVLASPFDHRRQVRFLVPSDFPEPTEPEHEARTAALLEEVIGYSGGRSLVLMTSYTALRRLHDRLAPALARQGIRVRRQGEAPRTDLLAALREGAREALLATDSFWEGIDVRGEALSLLALARLPFRVPTEPVLQARAERLEREGGNAFTGLLVPMAVLKFKQGMGRLIRHRGDRGVALVLDPRILRKAYGRTFLTSLDWGEPEVLAEAEVRRAVAEYFSHPAGAR
jgi:ATP-dependent DNA helicase DinG